MNYLSDDKADMDCCLVAAREAAKEQHDQELNEDDNEVVTRCAYLDTFYETAYELGYIRLPVKTRECDCPDVDSAGHRPHCGWAKTKDLLLQQRQHFFARYTGVYPT